MTETQERFLRAVADRVPVGQVAEVHLFPSLRQGQLESGVAVVAVEPDAVGGDAAAEAPSSGPPAAGDACDPTDDAAGGPPSPEAAGGAAGGAARGSPPTAHRLTIYTAHYRLTIKGPDRGKWELSVAAEADAPLVTLEAVVRGVRHRAGDGADTERLSGDEFRAAVAADAGAAWTSTR